MMHYNLWRREANKARAMEEYLERVRMEPEPVQLTEEALLRYRVTTPTQSVEVRARNAKQAQRAAADIWRIRKVPAETMVACIGVD